MCVGSTSSALTGAVGLFGLRKGSIRTMVSPSLSSNVAWPRYRISMCSTLLSSVLQFVGQREADRDPHEHPEPGLLGQQHAQRRDVRPARGPHDLVLVGVVEVPALVQGGVEDALQPGRRVDDDL